MVHDIWNQFLTIAREEFGSRVVETWFRAIVLVRWDILHKEVYLKAPNAFISDWIQKNYGTVLQVHLGRLVTIDKPRIIFVNNEQAIVAQLKESELSSSIALPMDVTPAKKTSMKVPYKKSLLHSHDYSFDTFVVGPHNSLAYAAAHAITEKPGKLYNPLFIYGGSGLGKTHLLNAISNKMQQNNGDVVILYQPADRFVNEFINAIRFDKIHRFQEKYQRVDVLLIDDVQFISNKEQTQEAFFHIFNSLYELRKQIVFSSDTFPQNIKGIAERLRSRLAWGLVTDIYTPGIETRIAILKKKALLNNEILEDDVAQRIAEYTISNIRELEGALIRVMAYASLTQKKITVELVEDVLQHHQSKQKPSITLDRILREVSKQSGYTPDAIQSKVRNKDIALARHITMFIMKSMTDKSLRDIGEFFTGRDHSTVMHAIEKIESIIKNKSEVSILVRRIQDALQRFE